MKNKISIWIIDLFFLHNNDKFPSSAATVDYDNCGAFQALVNEWDEQERRRREREQQEASLYRNRSRLHGSGLTEEEQEERDFRRRFPRFHQVLASHSEVTMITWSRGQEYLTVLSAHHQDFADITSEPSLEAPPPQEEEVEDLEDSDDCHFLSPAAVNTLVQIHQRLCLGYAQSLWYRATAPANHSKEHIQALVSSYQIASPLMSRFYHLLGP